MQLNYSRDKYLSEFSIKTLEDRYLVGDEKSPQDAFARAALSFSVQSAAAVASLAIAPAALLLLFDTSHSLPLPSEAFAALAVLLAACKLTLFENIVRIESLLDSTLASVTHSTAVVSSDGLPRSWLSSCDLPKMLSHSSATLCSWSLRS